MSFYLGIDTSAYTTSVAVVDSAFNIVWDKRILLKVEKGMRGLRQSEALFLHVKNLPIIFEELSQKHWTYQAMAVSATPRPIKDSYMPVFKAGESHAVSISSMIDIPLYKVSHQEGHIMAGLHNNQELLKEKTFIAVHFSGGTSELVSVKRGDKHYFDIDTKVEGLDLHAGQLVDRVGVAMGLSFPAGPEMERLAKKATKFDISLPSAVTVKGFSFSGAETKAIKLLNKGVDKSEIAFAVLRVIANTLEKLILRESKYNQSNKILLVGGVMANEIIRERLKARLEHPAVGLKLFFAEPKLSTDNAVGVALLAMLKNKLDFGG